MTNATFQSKNLSVVKFLRDHNYVVVFMKNFKEKGKWLVNSFLKLACLSSFVT